MEYASTFLMSFCTKAKSAATISVITPMIAIRLIAPGPMDKPSQNSG